MKWTEDDEKVSGEIETDTVYPFEIIEAEEKVSQKNNPYINVKLNVFVGEDTRTMYDILMPQMPGKLRAFCETLGLMDQYTNRTLTVTDCGSGEGFIRTSKKKNKDGYAQVESYLANDPTKGSKPQNRKPTVVPAGDSGVDDGIPF